MRKCFFIFKLIVVLVTMFFSCTPDAEIKLPKKEPDRPEPPIITIPFQDPTDDTGNYIVFSTNDKNRTTKDGATWWMPYYSADATNDIIETTVNKISGMSAYGFGIIFWIQDKYTVGVDFTAKNFYTVLIRVDGYFQIIKVVDGVQHPLKIDGSNVYNWKIPLDMNNKNILLTGKNQDNKIKVIITDDDADGYPYFQIYFNDKPAYEFEESYIKDGETDLPLFQYSAAEPKQHKYGFIVTLSPLEDFPYIPVTVFFKQLYPKL